MSAKPPSRRRDKDDTNNPDVHLPGIGNYIFQKTVGEGNFAKVKLAHHKLTGQETTLDEKKIGKLYREVRIMKMLHHPNIVKLYEVIETKSTVFLVMEYASGGELYDYLVVHGKMKEKEARAKFRQILSAVSYCHKKRVIHRDLKAENLLLDSNLNVKIADFGFGNYYDPESKLDTFCGSPPYAAPELFQGRRYTGPEVDIWSLGVILYVLTTGCLPFDGKNLQEMRESVCRGKYRIPFFLSDNCEKLLKKFLVRDPTKRPSLDIVIDDAWINESYDSSPITVDMSETIEEDEAIIKVIETKYKIDRETILNVLREKVYNDISAIYYLMYYDKESLKREAAGGDSNDVIKVNPTRKDTISSQTSSTNGKTMPIIDEDGVLADATKSSPSHEEDDASKKNAIAVHRKRAATVNANSKAPEITPKEEQADSRPKTAAPPPEKDKAPAQSATNPTPPPLPAEQNNRKRHNTIVGILRGLKHDDNDENPVGEDVEKPRSLRFTFNSNTTSSKQPDEIIVEVIKCCNKLGYTHRLLTRYLLECTALFPGAEPLRMEIEVCKLPRLNNLHGLRFKRLSGGSSEYKEVCEKLLETIKL